MAITTIKIYPSIGIARVGNSPTEFFIGPELPGDKTPPQGGYKDAQCRVKKQAARFRLFAYDENGILVKELTAADATITWTVHLANKKSAWEKFHATGTASPGLRNPAIANRNSLIIDPGSKSVTGINQAAGFNTGQFMGTLVPLGEMRTDDQGRLLVLGGNGRAGSPTNAPLTFWAQSDEWYDDVSDGPVTASVLLNGSNNPIQAASAWVICGPPKFAPTIDNAVTLYDILEQLAVDNFGFAIPAIPSFNHHIYPILDRALKMKWVTEKAANSHFSLTSAYPPAAQNVRQAVFNRLRDPLLAAHDPGPGGKNMPKQWSDVFDTTLDISLALTKTQYNYMQQWAAGNFTNDWTGNPPPAETTITPEGLTKAALENCVGGAFYPGIETSWMTRDTFVYTEPFRLDHTQIQPGDLTKQMAVPWHSDFLDCADGDTPYSWWPAQRPVDVWPEDGSPQTPWIRDLIDSTTTDSFFRSMVQNWFRFGYVVEKAGSLLETERHVICKSITLVTDRSTFGKDEVDAVLSGGSPAVFHDALYVIVEGFLPSEIGLTTANPTAAQLQAIAPQISIKRPDTSNTPGVSAFAENLLLENNALPPMLRQRFTFVYNVQFANNIAFTNVELEKESVIASLQTFSSNGLITLTDQPNPFMLDGAVHWLSTDVRVFKIKEGDPKFGQTMGNSIADAPTFIQSVLTHFNSLPAANHPFDPIPTDQQASQLELSRSVNGKRVFNFAIAKVRYFGQLLSATEVRAFFRLFTVAATGLDYNVNSTYRHFDDGTKVVPLLGFQGGEVVTVPCFAESRKDTSIASGTTQTDAPNIRTLNPSGATETHAYFGCWLDINQTETFIPLQANSGDGPYMPANMRSVQNTIRGVHQCLAVELYFPADPISQGDTPASNDNLSQRNLAIVESDNPGSPGSRTIVHTFEIKPSLNVFPVQEYLEGNNMNMTVAPRVAGQVDELMFRWHNLPPDCEISFYIPQIKADDILAMAGKMYEYKSLEKIDDHTIGCKQGEVTYLPVPANKDGNLAGLIRIDLPENIKYGQSFQVTVHQLSGNRKTRKIIGAFQLNIPVIKAVELLENESRRLSVLRSIHQSILPNNRWYPVFTRYIDAIAGRVKGFGGNPDIVIASPDGFDLYPTHDHPEESCDTICSPDDLLCLGIPWKECDYEGEIKIRIKFRSKKK